MGPDGRRSWDHSSHIVCVVAVRGHAPAPAAAESVVVSLPSLDFQAEWMQKDATAVGQAARVRNRWTSQHVQALSMQMHVLARKTRMLFKIVFSLQFLIKRF